MTGVQTCALPICFPVTISLQGGVLGPELNAPKNVAEYWQVNDLKNFIRNPESFRYQSKMPAFGHLSDADIEAILAYLQQMKQQKISRKPAGL